jgi:hypothetical protein
MQTDPRPEPTGSPIPGVIPEPVRVHHDPATGSERPPTTSGTTVPASPSGRPTPARILLAKLLSAIRGDKHMSDPPDGHGGTAARPGHHTTQPRDEGDTAAGGVTSRTKER